ncbi:MAG: 16S rRNA (adenine(1518)-N(6)/adenine(1519)-N(6))-dimethyltransferase RsmA [Actinomycetota bacterium]|nr:16S rRNA (adenine(1518)-N(6)/adenine(1519)-N(6))-dimethyltransferase RsmA [Actinomycetota bacterium]
MARLGQNFLVDTNLLDAIMRHAQLGPDEVVLEVGGGEGVLTERLAVQAAHVHVVELDEGLRERLERLAAVHPNVTPVLGDAMGVDLAGLVPAPTAMVANLPYSIATPILMRTLAELGGVGRWTAMVQLEIAERLAAQPRTKAYGSPSVLTQLCARVRILRRVDRAVFKPRPRVDSALIGLERIAPWPGDATAAVVRGAFAHRRKALARSVAMAGVESRDRVLAAVEAVGLMPTVRAEELEPAQFVRLARELGR